MLKLSIAAVAASLSLSGAYAQPVTVSPCAPLDEMMEKIIEGWGEEPLAAGLSSDGHVMQILTNPNTGSWTVLITNIATGQTCIADEGSDLMVVAGRPNV